MLRVWDCHEQQAGGHSDAGKSVQSACAQKHQPAAVGAIHRFGSTLAGSMTSVSVDVHGQGQ